MNRTAADAWSSMAADLAGTAILTDFDGTLSEVVVDPDAAVPLPGAVEAIEALAPRAHTVAVVSGRPLAFLAGRFGPAVTLAGLYGLETRRDGVVSGPAEVETWRSVIGATVERARAELPADVLIEPKGLAVTLHYRSTPEHRRVIEAWAGARAAETGLRTAEARCSVELNPPLAVDKGTVVADLIRAPGVRHACYLGDDRADIAAFDALRAEAGPGLDTWTVAVRGAETPQELLDEADEVVEGPPGVLALIGSLLR